MKPTTALFSPMEQSNTSTPTGGTEQVQTKTALEKALQEIKRRNEALRASEHDLNLIINTIPALVWSARPDGSAEFFNQHYLDYVGLPAEQLNDWGWTVAVHPADLNGLAGSWQSIMASGEQGESEARLRRFDGEYRWFLFRANPLRDESGNIVKWFGINTDIEDRKRAEDALRRSEGYLTEAQRLAHTGSWTWNVSTSTRAYWSQEKITACLASIRNWVYRQTKRFPSAFIPRIEIRCEEKLFLRGRPKAPTLTWSTESFFPMELSSTSIPSGVLS